MEYRIKMFKKYEADLIKEIERLKAIIFQKPASEYLEVHKEFSKLLDENTGDKRLTPEFMKKIDELAQREERAKKNMKKDLAIDREKLSSELVDAEFELQEIRNELWSLERRYKV